IGYFSGLSKRLTTTAAKGFRYLSSNCYLPTIKQIKYTTTIFMASYAIYMLHDMLSKKIASDLDKENEEENKSYKITEHTQEYSIKKTNLIDKKSVKNILDSSELETLIHCINNTNPITDKQVKIDEETSDHILLTESLLTNEERKQKLVWRYYLNDVQYELYFSSQKSYLTF
ncbi:hypothetical protein SNEBB_002021, partial [Seison nebaliae]